MGLFRRTPPEVPPAPSDPYLLHRYALETQRMANAQWDLVGIPWKWREWGRQHRIIDARIKATNAQLERLEGARATRQNGMEGT